MDHPKMRTDDAGNLFLNFGNYGEEVEVAAISGDGSRVLTVRDVGVAQVWEMGRESAVVELRPDSPLRGSGAAPHSGPFQVFIEAAALNRDGSLALLGLNDGTAVIYRVQGCELLAVLHRPGSEPGSAWGVIRSVRFSDDGRFALVGFPGRAVGVWSCEGGRLVAFLEPPRGGRIVGRPFVRDTLVSSVGMSTDGRFVFAGAVDLTAVVFELASVAVAFEATDHAESILAILDDGVRVGWATTGGNVWLSRSGAAPVKVLETGEAWAEVAFHGEQVLVRNVDGSIHLWWFSGQRVVQYVPADAKRVGWADDASTLGWDGARMHFPEGGRRLVLRDEQGSVVIERDAQLVRAELSPRGDVLGTDGWKNELELWQAATGGLRHALPCPGGPGCFAFSPDGTLVAAGELGQGGGLYPRRVYVYDVESGHLVAELGGHSWQVRQVAFSPDGRLLASVADDLLLWDVSKLRAGEPRLVLRVPDARSIGGIAFSGDRFVVLEDGRVRVYEGAEERLSFEASMDLRTPWAVSRQGDHLCIGGKQTVRRYELATGTLERELVADVARPECIPSFELALTHEIRSGALLWRTAHGCFLHQSDGPRGWTQPLELSPDGLVAVPCASRAAVLRVEPTGATLLGFVPFEGRLRAGRIIDHQVVLVNHGGQCFRSKLSDVGSAPAAP